MIVGCETRDRNRADTPCSLWLNRADRILSFARAEGFDRIKFTNYDQMMERAIQISRSGYRIQ